uniref:Uncharacterized protein n=1 Tax=Fagus sylvatica TaxID=28930 RepID=A0A2N9H7G6_FAGSY
MGRGRDRRRLADLEVVSRWLRSALSCRSGGGLAVVQLRGGAWVRNKLRGGAGLRRSEAEWLPAGLAVGQDVVAGGCVAVIMVGFRNVVAGGCGRVSVDS